MPDPAELASFVAMDAALREAEERWADLERGLVVDPDPPGDRWGSTGPPLPTASPLTASPPTASPPTDPPATSG